MPQDSMHILVLTDRDWTHPQGGGTGTNLFGQISRWLAWGHRVTVVASSYPGAVAEEHIGDLTIHRMGGRATVFPRAIWKLRRGLVPDADVVLEVVNGITFLTPMWMKLPRLTLIHHVHREHYAQELGRLGKVAAFLLETAPLRWVYAPSRFQTLSHAEAEKIAEHGIEPDRIDVNYIGVEAETFEPGERAERPTLLYLGRLKKYKRIELLLDSLEAIPEAVLEIAGEGDHRPDLEGEIARRGLSNRVRMHGHVSEEEKAELYRRAWVNLTASSAEGWCLTVMEAAACGTPSVAMAVGGLPESIDDGHTGLLAHDEHELAEKVSAVVSDPAERDRLGANALERARTFTWDAAARRSLDALAELRAEGAGTTASLRSQLAGSDTGRAAGLAGAVLAGNVVALVFTIAFARILGTSGYGTLAALVSTFLILQVPGSALQITVAREVATSLALDLEAPGAGVRRWLGRVALVTVVVAGIAVLLRHPIAEVIGVDAEWAAAATLPTGCLWLLASIERGALQGFRRYRAVGLSLIGEAIARLGFGLLLVAAGLGVTGAFLGTALSVLGMAIVLSFPLRQELERHGSLHPAVVHRFRDLVGRAWAPVVGLALLLTLQEIHVIVVKHQATDDAAGAYAAAAVAAKAIIWVAVGLGLYLLPEAARRTKSGVDARPVLYRTLALIGALALPMVLVYAVAAQPLLEIVFGESFAPAAGALPWLAIAMALLACAYLAVQYLLALGKAGFIVVLGIAAAAEPLLLLVIGAHLRDIALALFGLQLALATVVIAISLRSAAHPRPRPGALAV